MKNISKRQWCWRWNYHGQNMRITRKFYKHVNNEKILKPCEYQENSTNMWITKKFYKHLNNEEILNRMGTGKIQTNCLMFLHLSSWHLVSLFFTFCFCITSFSFFFLFSLAYRIDFLLFGVALRGINLKPRILRWKRNGFI